MRMRYLAVFSATISMIALLLLVPAAFAGFSNAGAGGCGNFDTVLGAAKAGDVIAPMRSSDANTNGVIISKTLVIQGGWDTAKNACTDAGTNQFADTAAMIAAGFSYDPSQGTEVFGDFTNSALRLNLTTGQTVVLQNLNTNAYSVNQNGNALSGTLNNGARLRLENLKFDSNQSGVNAIGGAIYLEVRGGSQLVIANSTFLNNNATSGGALEVRLFDNSSLLIEGSTFTNNNALTGNGGALRVVINSGSVTLRNNSFTNNSSTNGSGGAVAIERASGATGSASWISRGNSFSGNTASGAGTGDVFSTVGLLSPQAYLPLVLSPGTVSALSVRISAVTMSEAQYRVTFTTGGYTPALPGQHIHFFFNTVSPSQAGAGGSGPWKIYGSTAPFTQYGIADRPAGATQLCALVANPDHTVIQGTGNCVALP